MQKLPSWWFITACCVAWKNQLAMKNRLVKKKKDLLINQPAKSGSPNIYIMSISKEHGAEREEKGREGKEMN